MAVQCHSTAHGIYKNAVVSSPPCPSSAHYPITGKAATTKPLSPSQQLFMSGAVIDFLLHSDTDHYQLIQPNPCNSFRIVNLCYSEKLDLNF